MPLSQTYLERRPVNGIAKRRLPKNSSVVCGPCINAYVSGPWRGPWTVNPLRHCLKYDCHLARRQSNLFDQKSLGETQNQSSKLSKISCAVDWPGMPLCTSSRADTIQPSPINHSNNLISSSKNIQAAQVTVVKNGVVQGPSCMR
jgi:hypothetical protein